MNGSISLQALFAGLLAAFVGFASSFTVVVGGLTAIGATQAQAASGLMAASIAMGIGSVISSFSLRQPVKIAWSTPGAALLATGGALEGGFSAAVGAFIVCGGLIVLAGLWRPLGRAVANIPGPLANAMLAGVLLPLCLAPAKAMAAVPASALPIIATWALVGRWRRLYAVPAAVLVTAILAAAQAPASLLSEAGLWPQPVFAAPAFTSAAVIGVALPLFIVTMASQNIPGVAVLAANGYRPDPGPIFTFTGFLSLMAAPFGGIPINLAAITAAICAGPDAHADPARRYWAAAAAGAAYIGLGLLAGAATAFISASPPILIQAVAGLALLGALGSALMGAVAEARDREAAVVTFLISASGLTFWGVGGAFWGLLAGGAMMALAQPLSRWLERTDPP